jgi:hypothetical protein
MMEARLHQQEVHVERIRLRQEVADVTGNYDDVLISGPSASSLQCRSARSECRLGRVAEQYTSWLASARKRLLLGILQITLTPPSQEAVAACDRGRPQASPLAQKRTGNGASRVASDVATARLQGRSLRVRGPSKPLKMGTLNLFGYRR